MEGLFTFEVHDGYESLFTMDIEADDVEEAQNVANEQGMSAVEKSYPTIARHNEIQILLENIHYKSLRNE